MMDEQIQERADAELVSRWDTNRRQMDECGSGIHSWGAKLLGRRMCICGALEPESGRARKAAAMGRHETLSDDHIRLARRLGRIIAARNNASHVAAPTVDADQIRARFEELRPGCWGNWAGAIFRGKEWEMVGWTVSTRPESHARAIRIWRWNP
jgi:hypothetical protein